MSSPSQILRGRRRLKGGSVKERKAQSGGAKEHSASNEEASQLPEVVAVCWDPRESSCSAGIEGMASTTTRNGR